MTERERTACLEETEKKEAGARGRGWGGVGGGGMGGGEAGGNRHGNWVFISNDSTVTGILFTTADEPLAFLASCLKYATPSPSPPTQKGPPVFLFFLTCLLQY